VRASGKVELRQGSTLTGDLTAARLSIEENANFKGKVDLVQNAQKVQPGQPTPQKP
jgi:cytoskeletal protein CcmA (bactofilin family)